MANTDMVYELLEEPDTTNTDSMNTVVNIANGDEDGNGKLQKTLKLLALRDPCYLIQFWSPSNIGVYNILKTVDQPFALGIHNQGLLSYRHESERKCYLVNEECKEEVLTPIVRVFRRQLPEWTSDVKNYHLKKHPLQGCTTCWNLHGYLVLPVFDSITMLCVGVLELITSSKHLDFAYEVQEVHRTLKESNLTSPQAFDCPISYVNYKNIQHELDNIFKFLKDVCDTHKLPLAQTWIVSSRSSFVATERNIEMTCNSFNNNCIGKVCLSTTSLPFYVQDLRFWHFREACRKHHLLKSKGVVGRAFSSHGSCFCVDVTKLQEDEYSLVHNARMSRLSSCYVVYLHSNEHDEGYILEFFLPIDMKEDTELQNLLQMMKMHFNYYSFEFGDLLNMDEIRIPMEATQISLTMQSTIHNSSSKEIMHLVPTKAWGTNAQIDYLNAHDDQCAFSQVSHKNSNTAISSSDEVYDDDVITSKNIDIARWRICSKRNPIVLPKSETVCVPYAHVSVYQASQKKKKIIDVLDMTVIVKATFKEDMIKFQFPLSSGVSELKNQVAQRFMLKATRLSLRYTDEDGDMILISCDADFRNLMPFSASPVGKNTIKLIIQVDD